MPWELGARLFCFRLRAVARAPIARHGSAPRSRVRQNSGRTPNPSSAASSHATSSATVRTSAHASSVSGSKASSSSTPGSPRPADGRRRHGAARAPELSRSCATRETQTPATSRIVSSAPAIAHFTVGPCAQPNHPMAAPASALAHVFVHARGEMLPEERRRLRHLDVCGPRERLAQVIGASRGTRRTRRGGPRAPARASPSTRSTNLASLRCVIAATSSSSPARGRGSPSPRRPSCQGCRQSPRAAAHDISAESASRAASAAAARMAARTSAARSSRRSAASGRSARRSSDRSARLERLALRRLERQPIEADVHRDAIEPGREARLPFESLEALERANECVLRQVGRVLVIADISVAQLIHLAAVALDDDVEGRALTGEAQSDERPVVGLGPRRVERDGIALRRQRGWSSQATRVPSRRGSAR